ncbi:MAG: MBL fold metallo-hydrolase [Pseudomonadota bacterium]
MRFVLTAVFSIFATVAFAQVEHTPSHCIAMVDNGPYVQQASTQALVKDEVRITFIDHSMFRIDTFGGLSAITDFNGYIGRNPDYPTVVTMNRAHDSHYTNNVPPEVRHILRGWGTAGAPADHNLDLGEMRIRNVTTDIRSEWTGRDPDGNSIFVFEVGGLCIGHLGHLHHEPSDLQYALIGRLDVVMANVDGGLSLDTETMIRIMKRFRASVVLPMHYWGRASLNRFLAGMSDEFEVVDVEAASLIVSQDTLPLRPTVYVLPPQLFNLYNDADE